MILVIVLNDSVIRRPISYDSVIMSWSQVIIMTFWPSRWHCHSGPYTLVMVSFDLSRVSLSFPRSLVVITIALSSFRNVLSLGHNDVWFIPEWLCHSEPVTFLYSEWLCHSGAGLMITMTLSSFQNDSVFLAHATALAVIIILSFMNEWVILGILLFE